MFDTNILNLIIIGLIFLSLVVIIAILGKNIKKLKEFKMMERENNQEGNLSVPGKMKRLQNVFWRAVKNSLILLAEWFVTHAKKILHLVHFWLIKLRRGKKGDEIMDEMEAKEELINEEEKNLSTIINEDLGIASEQEELEKAFMTKDLGHRTQVFVETDGAPHGQGTEFVEEEAEVIENHRDDKISKLKKFFLSKKQPDQPADELVVEEEFEAGISTEQVQYEQEGQTEEQAEQQEPQQGWAKRLAGKLNFFSKKERIVEAEDGSKVEYESDLSRESFDDEFSDGVVKIEKPDLRPKDELLMKEVVVSKYGRQQTDQDDELGVDRKILEKKILQKIAKDPKNIENYRQLGELYIKMKNYSDAEDTYRFIVKMSPRDADAKRKIEKIKLLKRLG